MVKPTPSIEALLDRAARSWPTSTRTNIVLSGSLAFVARFFDERPEVDVVYGDRLLIDEYDGDIGKWILPEHDDTILTLADYVPAGDIVLAASHLGQVRRVSRPIIWLRNRLGFALAFSRGGCGHGSCAEIHRRIPCARRTEDHGGRCGRPRGVCAPARASHGRPVILEEVIARQRPYMRRHIIAHTRRRLSGPPPSVADTGGNAPAQDALHPPVTA